MTWFAVRTIGRSHMPYRITALAGFTSYSIGHNVGASVFTGGAVRYRIYSAWGLDAVEVAKICFLAGLTFWLGNAAVLGLGVAYHPEAASSIDQLPLWLNRVLAFGVLIGLIGYVAWVWVHAARRRPRQLDGALPDGPLTLLQIVIGIVDLGFCALAMYVLVPDAPPYRLCRRRGDLRHRRRCSASPAIRRAGSACSTPRCWSALWQLRPRGAAGRLAAVPRCCIISCRSSFLSSCCRFGRFIIVFGAEAPAQTRAEEARRGAAEARRVAFLPRIGGISGRVTSAGARTSANSERENRCTAHDGDIPNSGFAPWPDRLRRSADHSDRRLPRFFSASVVFGGPDAGAGRIELFIVDRGRGAGAVALCISPVPHQRRLDRRRGPA